MTEDEAKRKWCLRGPTPSKAEHCIAAKCMAWRWADEIERPRTQDAPYRDGWQHGAQTPHGYCGLAGAPQ